MLFAMKRTLDFTDLEPVHLAKILKCMYADYSAAERAAFAEGMIRLAGLSGGKQELKFKEREELATWQARIRKEITK
jgi:hypothetical protein